MQFAIYSQDYHDAGPCNPRLFLGCGSCRVPHTSTSTYLRDSKVVNLPCSFDLIAAPLLQHYLISMPDPFSTLTLPLPLFILNGLEDLGTLHYLLQASRAASAVFAEHYCEIIESILSNFVPLLQRLLRAVVYTRSQPANIRAQCDTVQALDILRCTRYLDAGAGATPLNTATVKLAAARSLAETASQVQSLSAVFFVKLFERINRLEPYCTYERRRTWMDQWDPVPSSFHRRYQVLRCEKASWIEEQRVLRALWRIVIYLDLQKILRPCEGQASEIWDKLVQDGPRCVWWKSHLDVYINLQDLVHPTWSPNPLGLDRCHMDEMDTVVNFLSDIQGRAVQATTRSAHLQNLPQIDVNPVSVPRMIPPFSDTAEKWNQLPLELGCPSPGYEWFHRMQEYFRRLSRDKNQDPQLSPYAYDWSIFQSLGMGIWDREHLARLGLADIRKVWREVPTAYRFLQRNYPPDKHELSIRWKSLRRS